MLVWRLRNKKELLDGLLYELSALFPLPVLYEMYEPAINDEDHSSWYINLVAKKKEDMIFNRLHLIHIGRCRRSYTCTLVRT